MSGSSAPELRWAPPPRRRGPRLWLVILLSIIAVVVAGGVLIVTLLALRPGDHPRPAATDTNSQSAAPVTPSAPPSSPPPSEGATASPPAPPTQPAPDLSAFRGQVEPRLSDANTGLTMVAKNPSSPDTASTLEQLQNDAEWLSGLVAPTSVQSSWNTALSRYTAALNALSTAPGDAGSLAATRDALTQLRDVVGS